MGRLSEINAQIEAISNKRPLPKTDAQSHVEAIVEAIKGVQLNIEANEGYDYTPEMQRLGEAVTKALKAHGDGLIKALSQITVNVEAPTVNVEAPQVSCNPEFEINMPDMASTYFRIERNRDGVMVGVEAIERPPEKAKAEMEIE